MKHHVVAFVVLTALSASQAGAQGYNDTRAANALRDSARAQERTARSLERIERQDRDRATREDRARHNAEVTSRSARRFD